MKKLMLLPLLLCTILGGCKPAADMTSTVKDSYILNTVITQQIYGENGDEAAAAVEAELRKLEQQLSLYVEGSDIDKINKNAGLEPVKVNDFTYELIKTALEYSRLSNGIFDITIAPLTTLWGISGDSPRLPSEDEIATAVSLIGYEKVVVDDSASTVFLTEKGMALDLGGVAKGYFCKIISEIYEKHEIDSAFCSIGGNILTYGIKPDGKPFKLGIRDPNGETASELFATITSSNEVVATTGGYERFFEQDGVRYIHILSTENGMPIESDIISATVISSDGGLADFLSTALFIAGSDHIESYIDNENFSVVIVTEDKRVYASSSIKNRLSIIDDEYTLE